MLNVCVSGEVWNSVCESIQHICVWACGKIIQVLPTANHKMSHKQQLHNVHSPNMTQDQIWKDMLRKYLEKTDFKKGTEGDKEKTV